MQNSDENINIVQISDTHFGTEVPDVCRSLIDTINCIRPKVLIHSGDITQRARTTQFQAAYNFIKQLQFDHLLVTPGNHDVPLYNLIARCLWAYKNYNNWFGGLPNTLVLEPVAVISLNSCNLWHYKNGILNDAEIQKAERFFVQVPSDLFKIVVAHHPVDAILPSDEANIAAYSHYAIRRLEKVGADLIMGGHIHNQFVQSLKGRYPDLKRNFWVSQAGTATSARTRVGLSNAFTHLQIDKACRSVTVQIWEFCKTGHLFIPRDNVILR